MTTREAKQEYLRESILNDNMDTESFINFMEGDKERGADLDRWGIDDLKSKVKEFKETYPQRKASKLRGELLQNVDKSERGIESDEEDKKKGAVLAEGEEEPERDSKYYGRKDCIKL
jgi:hypothetical protein